MIIIIIYRVAIMEHHKQVEIILQEWERLTLQGNEYFQRHVWGDAYRCFEQSMQLVDPGLTNSGKRQQWRMLRLFVLSCQNTAHVAEKMGRDKDAEHYFSHAHFSLLSLISYPATARDLCQRALLEISASQSALEDFLRRKGKQSLMQSIREETDRVIFQQGSLYVSQVINNPSLGLFV
jgi:hypothetical protein